jgi:hypothetical protein
MDLERAATLKKNEDDASAAAKQVADTAAAAETLSSEAQVRQQEMLELSETNDFRQKRIRELEEEASIMAIKAETTQQYADNLTRSNEEMKQHNNVLMKELCAWRTQSASTEPSPTQSYASVAARPRGATLTAATIENQLWISQEQERVRLAKEEADFDKAMSDSKTDSTMISSTMIENSDTSDTDSDRPPSGRHGMSGRNKGAQGQGQGAGTSGKPAPKRTQGTKSESGKGKKANAASQPGEPPWANPPRHQWTQPLGHRNLRRPSRPNRGDKILNNLWVIQAQRRQIWRRQHGQRQHRGPTQTIPMNLRTLSRQRTRPTR